MTQDQALDIVMRQADKIGLDPVMEFHHGERAIVEYCRDRSRPGRAKDRVAWVLYFRSELGRMEVQVDDRKGDILLVVRE